MLFDTHAHLDDSRFDADRDAVIAALKENGVGLLVNAGADLASSRTALALSHKYPFIYAAAGLHPGELLQAKEDDLQNIETLLADPKAVAVGEIGLDYHYDDDAPHLVQLEWFNRQLDMALRLNKPVVIHSRDAVQDTLNMLRRYAGKLRGQMHCFSGSWETAKAYLDMGFYISFSGSLTFRNAARLPEVAVRVPLDRLLIETDSPYMAPVPHRGKRNEPAYVRQVAQRLGELRGLNYEETCRYTCDNGMRLFGITDVSP